MYSVYEKPQWRHPIITIKSFFVSKKWAKQRARKGYCELDTYSVSDWFLNTLPDMLEEIKNNCTGYPDELTEDEWIRILDRMIFLLHEANKDTCTKVNPYKAEYSRISDEFRAKYGEWGEKLLTDEQKAEAKKTGSSRIYLPSDMPEYKEICEQYSEEEHKLSAYREKCKNEALELFSKWFYSLGF